MYFMLNGVDHLCNLRDLTMYDIQRVLEYQISVLYPLFPLIATHIDRYKMCAVKYKETDLFNGRL